LPLRPLELLTTASFSVLTAIGAFVFLPLFPVPVTLQTLFTYLSGAALGPWLGALSQVIYILLGGIGLPIFAGGKAGFGVLIGPTGGYLLGFIVSSFLIGKISDLQTRPNYARIIGSLLLGTAVIYLCGILQLSQWMNGDFQRALLVGVLPFIPGDAIKIAIATVVAARLRDILPRTNFRGRDFEEYPLGDEGRVLTYTKLWAIPEGIGQLPLTLAIVEFDGKVRATGQVLSEGIKVGDRVRPVWGHIRKIRGKEIQGFRFERLP